MVTLDEHSGFILWGQRDSSVRTKVLIPVNPQNIQLRTSTSTSWWLERKSERIVKVRRVHPLGNMNPSNRRSEILTVPSRGSDESSVIQRLSHANFNQSDQQLTSVPTRRVRGETTENVFSRVVLCSDRSDAKAATLTSGRAVTSLAGRHF